MRREGGSRLQLAARYAVMIVCAAALIGPFVWMVLASLKTDADIGRLPPTIIPDPVTGENYRRVVDSFPFWRFARNSVLVAVISTALQLIVASTAAYAFARIEFRGRSLLFGIYLATMMIPLQVIIVPLFIEMRNLQLVDSFAALILPTIVSSFGVFLLRQAFSALPRELDEAAFIDGAGHFRVFARVLLPLIGPALATFAVFAFMSTWNSFIWPLVITQASDRHVTLPVGLSRLNGRFSTDWNVVMAGSVMTIVPILAFYLVTQRWVIRSVAFAGLKG
ncbi:carbohydrate ABC transporter permease [Desertimonas flava]|uniref:carbohydrate ABC transporter permease n=1 Tax=Desertimonas flava TaxID=2064846 RepID=UPI000E34627A|nr:carbohydrate ABC transporter permease [Desertimonas flava]